MIADRPSASVFPGLSRTLLGVIGGAGWVAAVTAVIAARCWQFQIVRYMPQRFVPDGLPWPEAVAVLILLLLAWIAFRQVRGTVAGAISGIVEPSSPHRGRTDHADIARAEARGSGDGNEQRPRTVAWWRGLSLLAPLVLAVPMAAACLGGWAPPVWSALALVFGTAWSGYLVGRRIDDRGESAHGGVVPFALLAAAVAGLIVLHTLIQVEFFEHFMLGHADIGHFTEELKNALRGRGLRSDSFPNTRLGWHFTPLLYVLVPGYALFPTPVYLMVWSAGFAFLPALVIFRLIRRRGGSGRAALLIALAWTLLPSTTRLIYAGTYGFQWTCAVMVLLTLLVAAGETDRWRAALGIAVLSLLHRETTAAAVFGWGLFLVLENRRPRLGLAVAGTALLYVIVVVAWVIPAFSAAGTYQRFDLYGALGRHPLAWVSAVWHDHSLARRFVRREAVYLLLMLIAPLAGLPLRRWRLAVAALPTFLMIVPLENPDWLSIKFWHHCAMLPFLFLAAVTPADHETGSERGRHAETIPSRPHHSSGGPRWMGRALAVFFGAATAHVFFGFSPWAKAYAPVREVLRRPDPRRPVVERIRNMIPRTSSVLATERLAAHFTDYDRIYTGKRKGALDAADYVIIDRSDRWDRSGLVEREPSIAADKRFRRFHEEAGIVVYARRDETTSDTLDRRFLHRPLTERPVPSCGCQAYRSVGIRDNES
ncbi:MAG: DUF2079 domain-containing protein [Planctomycetota bacterium]|nr:MAG: DUF2079 domain-containing protein [Planctomycetota bacterium]